MQDQRAYVVGLRQAISDVRLDAYRRPGDADDLDAVARYLWNIALSEALYPTLQALEITLRNSLHLAISKHFRDVMWFDRQPSLLHQLELDKVAAAKRELQQEHKPLEAGRIVAELSFGFWTSLFDRRYERVLWPVLLKPAFPTMPRRIRTRHELSRRLNQVRRLRNRVFHHESILNWKNPDLQTQHAQIIEVISWMNQTMAVTIGFLDHFTAIYGGGPSAFRTKVEHYLGAQP